MLYVNEATGEIVDDIQPPGFKPIDHVTPPLLRMALIRLWRLEKRLERATNA